MDYSLVKAFAELYAAMKGSSIEQYTHFRHTMGDDCPYTEKAARVFYRRDKDRMVASAKKLLKLLEDEHA